MSLQKCLITIVLFFTSASSTPVFSGNIISFSSLPPGDIIEVRVEKSGCFNWSLHKLVFNMTPRRKVEISEIPHKVTTDIEQSWIKAGDIDLALDDLHRLDLQLAYYRKDKEGDCTSSTKISLTQFHEDKPIYSEHWEDYSCKATIDNRTDILWFEELIMRVHNKSKNGSSSQSKE